MHSSLVRLQNVFGFFTTVSFVMAGLVAVSVFLVPQAPTAEIKLRSTQVVKGRPHYYSPKREEYAHIKFDLDADLTSLFTWNTKQLFVYVQATYPSTNTNLPMSESIIWDIIIPSTLSENPPNPLAYLTSLYSPSFSSTTKSKSSRKPTTPKSKSPKETKPAPGLLKLRNQKPKYQITDISGLLAERTNVTLSVGWNIQPWVGALLWNGYPTPKNWKALSGGRSEAFSFPPIKGKKKEETVVGKGEVPRAGGAEPVVGGRG